MQLYSKACKLKERSLAEKQRMLVKANLEISSSVILRDSRIKKNCVTNKKRRDSQGFFVYALRMLFFPSGCINMILHVKIYFKTTVVPAFIPVAITQHITPVSE